MTLPAQVEAKALLNVFPTKQKQAQRKKGRGFGVAVRFWRRFKLAMAKLSSLPLVGRLDSRYCPDGPLISKLTYSLLFTVQRVHSYHPDPSPKPLETQTMLSIPNFKGIISLLGSLVLRPAYPVLQADQSAQLNGFKPISKSERSLWGNSPGNEVPFIVLLLLNVLFSLKYNPDTILS
jgi:hypothetical protein